MSVGLFYNGSQRGDFGPEPGRLTQRGEPADDGPLEGHLTSLGGTSAVLHGDNGVPRLRLDETVFPIADTVTGQWKMLRGAVWDQFELVEQPVSEITVLSGGQPEVSAQYWPGVDSGPPSGYSSTEYDDEHFDFDLFVFDVWSDPERRDRIYSAD